MRKSASLRPKCQKCPVARKVGGCLFGCSKKERLARELELLIQDADSQIDPMMEQLRQCPEAFEAGRVIEEIFKQQFRANDSRGLPPTGTVMSPFV